MNALLHYLFVHVWLHECRVANAKAIIIAAIIELKTFAFVEFERHK